VHTEEVSAADIASRFLSLDPIGREYPELTPYQFAANTPLQAIDLDGLEPFFVMGTNQNQTKDLQGYGKKEANGYPTTFTKPMLENLTYVACNVATSAHKELLDYGFSWQNLNHTTNNVNDRKIAAQQLADYVIGVHGKKSKDEPITLIGYSHGGNVALQAAPIIKEKLGVKVNIITINTPTSNQPEFTDIGGKERGGTTTNPRWIENPENPKIKDAVNSHYHFYTKKTDWTVKGSWYLEESSNSYKSKIPVTIQTDSNEHCSEHGNIYCPVIQPAFENSKQSRQSKPN
jgi:hypothetical protein